MLRLLPHLAHHVALTGTGGVEPDQVERLQGDVIARQRLQRFRHGRERRRLAQRRTLRAGHQHEPGALRIGQGVNRRPVLRTLLLQPGQRAQAGSVTVAGLQKADSCPWQLQQPDPVAGRRGIEHDVIESCRELRADQQRRELVERGVLGRAGARHLRDRTNPVADLKPEHLADIGRQIGADQQHAPSCRGQLHGSGTGDRSLADPALAGEEQEARRRLEELHAEPPTGQQQLPPVQQPDSTLGSGARAGAQPLAAATCAVGEATPAQRARSARVG